MGSGSSVPNRLNVTQTAEFISSTSYSFGVLWLDGFDKMKDSTGTISRAEAQDLVTQYCSRHSSKQVRKGITHLINKKLDPDHSSRISINIQTAVQDTSCRNRRQVMIGADDAADNDIPTRIKNTFEKFDIDKSGAVDIEELQWYLGSDSAAEKMLSDFDTIQVDGNISFDEWQGYFSSLGQINSKCVHTHHVRMHIHHARMHPPLYISACVFKCVHLYCTLQPLCLVPVLLCLRK